jgi:hypothetical protein
MVFVIINRLAVEMVCQDRFCLSSIGMDFFFMFLQMPFSLKSLSTFYAHKGVIEF